MPIVIRSLGIPIAKLTLVDVVGSRLITNKSLLDLGLSPWISPLDLELSRRISLLDVRLLLTTLGLDSR